MSLSQPKLRFASLCGAGCFRCGALPDAGERTDARRLSPLKYCGGCRFLAFCGVECQKLAWSEGHKKSCKHFATLPRLRAEEHSEASASLEQRWLEACKFRLNHLEQSLNRPLEKIEQDLIVYEVHCVCCLAVRDKGTRLLACPRCHWDFRCPAHVNNADGEHTEEQCDSFLLLNECDKFEQKHRAAHNGEYFVYAPDASCNYKRDSLPGNWEEFFQWRTPDELRSALPSTFFLVATKLLSQPLTCLLALDHFEHDADAKELLIHVVGAAGSYELIPTIVWEEIMHERPKLQNLKVVFIGPELTLQDRETYLETGLPVCPSCQASNSLRSYGLWSGSYQDFCASKRFQTPDLIVAFNSGVHELGPWTPALQCMLDLDVPLCFTSYTANEAMEDVATLQKLGANLSFPARSNPFQSLVPIVDPVKPASLFYLNNFYSCFRGRTQK